MNTKKGEGNIYDRIFKENAEQLFLPLIEKELGKKVKRYEILPTKLPKTFEREVDSLYKVELHNGNVELIHVEFQTHDDIEMIFRMGIYHGLVLGKYKLPINHVVIYLGKGKSKMRNVLKQGETFKGFNLISINAISSDELIQSQIPEVLILSILGKYKKEQTEVILRSILKKLKKVSKSKNEMSKFQQQLIILSRLRKLEDTTIKIIDNMPIEYDIESDYLYKQGIELGTKQGIVLGKEEGKIEGKEEGKIEGKIEGKAEGIQMAVEIISLYNKGVSNKELAKKFGLEVAKINEIVSKI